MTGIDRASRHAIATYWRRWGGVMRSDGRASRLLVLIGLVSSAGAAVAAIAAVRLAESPPHGRQYLSLAAILALAMVAERFPVSVENASLRGHSLASVFNVAGIVLFGWEPMVFVCIISLVVVDLWMQRPRMRIVYNAAALAISALAGGLMIGLLPGTTRLGELVGGIALAAAGYAGVSYLLISAAISLSDGKRLLRTLRHVFRVGILPFFFCLSAAVMLVVLWQRSPSLVFSLAGPLLAIDLFERQREKARSAMQLASTDPLTGLGNTRRFHERLQQLLDEAESLDRPLALCIFDLDNLKVVNDEYGHPIGDRVLVTVASRLRHGGEAFRLGGDEFAVLLSGSSSDEAVSVATAILERVAMLKIADLPKLTMSCGVAVFPSEGVARHDLLRLADSALYWAKDHGKNRVRVYHPEALSAYALEQLGANADLNDRLRAAASLADAVDARDAHVGAHSRRVGELAAQIAEHLGADRKRVEMLRLAGHLHDVGKLAIPQELLCKEDPLSDAELVLLQRHPEIGFQMIESLGLGPVAEWVLHHHERWDGLGYPRGLAAEEIPLGARIIFVADAWDSMTSERTYRRGMSPVGAQQEMQSRAGSQFDPEIVRALLAELGLISELEPVI